MTNDSVICDTPRYVLLEDREPIGPWVAEDSSQSGSHVIYGFSCKHTYDVFTSNCDKELRPYPLMKGYLRNRIEEEADEFHLVVIDAVTPNDDCLTVATMDNVLAAQDAGGQRMTNGFYVRRDTQSTEYQWNPTEPK